MKDFTLDSYKRYLSSISSKVSRFLKFEDYMASPEEYDSFCLIRHDVDRKPKSALKMALMEHLIGIKASYYFRYKPNTFKPDIIRKIHDLGHEIGYHYECLSDTRGNYEKALINFDKNLRKFRQITPVKTVSMHGRPLKPYDNRDIWKGEQRHKLLKKKFELIGELYLDIDYTDIAYINDTGRNWTSSRANKLDKVISKIKADFNSGRELLNYFDNDPHPKICFQVHPERWSDNMFNWIIQLIKDRLINIAKYIFSKIL